MRIACILLGIPLLPVWLAGFFYFLCRFMFWRGYSGGQLLLGQWPFAGDVDEIVEYTRKINAARGTGTG